MQYYILLVTLLVTSTPAQQNFTPDNPELAFPDYKHKQFYPPKQQGLDTVKLHRARSYGPNTQSLAWTIPTFNGKPNGTAIAYHPNGDTAGVFQLTDNIPTPNQTSWHSNPCDTTKPADPIKNFCRTYYTYGTKPGQLLSYERTDHHKRTLRISQCDGTLEHGTTRLYLPKALHPYYVANYYHGTMDGWAYRVDSRGAPYDSTLWRNGAPTKP